MDRTNPMDKHMEVMINRYGMTAAPAAPQLFGNAGKEHMEKYGTCVLDTEIAYMVLNVKVMVVKCIDVMILRYNKQ